MSKESLDQLVTELKYSVLFDTAAWMSDNLKTGCLRCASFLNRKQVQEYPRKPINLLTEE